ncbi:MAG TPA: ABC transporter substrate-binding protein [Salinimicrobium sp.]|nr:ABC transporter substrate-binding protein [Salinimicrobium sp.]
MKKSAIYKLTFLFSAICLLIFSSCESEDTKNRDHLVFRYNEHANITTLDPAFAKDQRNIWAANQLFTGLVQLDDSLNIKPDIAKNWTISNDGLTYTFNLRNDVYFHKNAIFGSDSTRTVTAEDFIFSLKRLTDEKIASPGSWIMQNVDFFNAENDSTLSIKLKQQFPAFLGLLSMKYSSVVPVEIATHNINLRRNPIGTGPFKFKRWEENEKLVFRKNELFYEKDEAGNRLPYLEAVAVTFLPDKQSEFLEFAQGNIDFLSGLDPSYKDEILTATGEIKEKYAHINMITGPYLNTEYLGIFLDSKTPETQFLNLRKAINYGFDRKTMIRYLRNNVGIPAENGFIPQGLPGFQNLKGYSYDPEKARGLVNEYIAETGDKNPEISISTTANYLDLVEFIQRELQKINIKVNINVMPPSTLLQQRSAGKLDFFRSSWIADYPDAENYLSLFYSENFSPNGPNYTHFQSAEYDKLYEQATISNSTKERLNLYRKMDSIIIARAPIVPLYYDEVVRFTQPNVKGLGINAINLLDLRRVRKVPSN